MLFLILTMAVPKSVLAGTEEKEITLKLPLMMGQNNLGKDFWFSIPPVYERESGGNINFVKVLVACPEETPVNLEIPVTGRNMTLNTIPNGVIEFVLPPAEASAISHDGSQQKPPPGQVYKGAAIHVTSGAPIVVYVIIKFKYTTDGFLALPSNAYGTKYINMVYREPNITSGLMAPFTCVVGVYDNTTVNLIAGGGDQGTDGIPLKGRVVRTGEGASEVLQRGDVWLLSVDDHLQDLSGTVFTANKPFSIVSGVHCANFPVGNSWCDYSVEMELPTYTWGKVCYVTPMKKRKFNGIIRIYASEDKTEVFQDGAYIGTIKKGGGGGQGVAYIEKRVHNEFDDFGQPIEPKIATITADKPIQVMYYNTGTQEDNNPLANSDPFMMLMSPIEQFQTEMYFASPNALGGEVDFTENYVNLVYETDGDIFPQDLMYAEMSTTGREPDWKPISQVFSVAVDKFKVPHKGKIYGTSTLTLPSEGVYGIKSDSTKFVAYSYGYAPYESYGFPTAAALRDLTSPDTNAPIPSYVQTCDGDVERDMGTVTDMPDDDETRSNMADLYMINDLSENYEFNWRSRSGEFIPGQQRTLSWWLTVLDKKKYARAVLYFTDRAGNDTTITVEYHPPEYEVTGDLHYGTLAETGPPVILKDTIRNLSTSSPLYVTRVELQNGNQGFSIDSYEPAGWTPPMPIGPGQEVVVKIKFDPAVAMAGGKKPIYKDSLGVGYGDENFVECGFAYETLQDAFIGAPKIVVDDWDFGSHNIATVGTLSRVIVIKNEGDKALHIWGISSDLTVSEFTHNFNTTFPNVSKATPLIIAPQKSESFTAFFKPTAAVTYTDQIVFDSDAGTDIDNICVLKGQGTSGNVSANGAIWGRYLINRPAPHTAGPYAVEATVTHKGLLVQNLAKIGSDIKTRVEKVIVTENPAGAKEYFRAGGMNIEDFINANVKGKFLNPEEKIEEVVQYLPLAKGDHSVSIELIFDGAVGNASVEIEYFGTGLVPNLEVTDVVYPTPMLIDNEANFQTGQSMVITNTQDDYGYPLTVSNVIFAADADVSRDIMDFQGKPYRIDLALLNSLTSTPIPVGESVTIPVEFVARNLLNPVTATLVTNGDTSADTYDDHSDWTGIGFNIGLNVLPADTNICVGESALMKVVISNTSDLDIQIDRLSLQLNGADISDLDGDGTDDISINNNLSPIVTKDGGVWTVNIIYNPSALTGIIKLDLNIEHQYKALAITGADESITVSSKAFDGYTVSNVTGSATTTSGNGFDKRFMVSIGDAFFYEIMTTKDATGADVQSVDVELNYNRFFVQPEFSKGDLSKIELATNNMVIVPDSFKNDAVTGGNIGSQLIKFTIQSTDGTPVLANPTTLVRLPFLAVLPADSEEFDPKDVLGTKGENLGLFDMSHTLSDADCYTHDQDRVEVGINEICTGDLRLLYIGEAIVAPVVRPNPISTGNGTIEYSVPFDRPGQIVLYDASMKQVAVLYDGTMKQGRQTVEVPVNQLANGSYFFKIDMGHEKAMGRFIIQK